MPTALARASRGVPLLALLALLATALVVGAAPAHAHTGLTASVPADGAQVAQAPDAVRLTFAEQVRADLAHVAVTGPDGADVAAGAPQVDGVIVVQGLGPLTVAGDYTVAYRVVGPDGHPVTGTSRFTLTAAAVEPAAEEPVPAAADPSPAAAGGSDAAPAAAPAADSGADDGPGLGGLLLAGAVALAGLTLFGWWARRRRSTGRAGAQW